METKVLKVKPQKRGKFVACGFVALNDTAVEEPQPKKKRASKAAKDPNKPKKGLSAFMFFSTETRAKVKSDNPDMKFGDIAKEIANQWRELDDNQKKKYDQLAANDKKRYEKDMENYKKMANTSARV